MDEDLLAVLAHGWVNTMSVISGAAETLLAFEAQLPPEKRDELLAMIRTHATYLQSEIHDAILGANP